LRLEKTCHLEFLADEGLLFQSSAAFAATSAQITASMEWGTTGPLGFDEFCEEKSVEFVRSNSLDHWTTSFPCSRMVRKNVD